MPTTLELRGGLASSLPLFSDENYDSAQNDVLIGPNYSRRLGLLLEIARYIVGAPIADKNAHSPRYTPYIHLQHDAKVHYISAPPGRYPAAVHDLQQYWP